MTTGGFEWATISTEDFGKLTTAEQLSDMREFRDTVPVRLVIHTALKMGSEGGGLDLLRQFRTRFRKDPEPHSSYCRWYVMPERTGPDKRLSEDIEARLKRVLQARGWQIGKLSLSKGNSRKRPRYQVRVNVNVNNRPRTFTYVMAREQVRYGPIDGNDWEPRVGDVVLFCPETGIPLGPWVMVVTFTLVERPSAR